MNKLLVFSGAGLSAQSGIPVFRSDHGPALWNNHSVEEVCSMRTLEKNKKIVNEFYDERRAQLKDIEPHRGYEILKDLSQFYDTKFFTSNVDLLHEKAGLECQHVHGKITDIYCMGCNTFSDIGYLPFSEAKEKGLIKHREHCPRENLKPGVTFFHESYDAYPAHQNLISEIRNLGHNDIVLIIGASFNVVPIDYWLRHTRCHKYNINPTDSAGYKNSYRYWNNIMDDAISGLSRVSNILEHYRKS